MSISKDIINAVSFVALCALPGVITAETTVSETLSLQYAEQLALERDPVLSMKRAQSQAFLDKSVAADTLPDPKLKLGLLNYPTDTFDRDQEPMTQTRIAILSGDTPLRNRI